MKENFFEDSLDYIKGAFLVLIALMVAFYVLRLNSVLWNPPLGFGGRVVNQRNVHRLGVNAWFYKTELKPFTGIATRTQSADKNKKQWVDVFREGMLHHREIFEETGSKIIIKISYLNEQIKFVEFWDKSGSYLGKFTERENSKPSKN